MGRPKAIRRKDKALLERVRCQKCAACLPHLAAPWSQAHHVTTVGAGGGDTPDNVMPLCLLHHIEWHQIGPTRMMDNYEGVRDWLQRHGREDILSIEQAK